MLLAPFLDGEQYRFQILSVIGQAIFYRHRHGAYLVYVFEGEATIAKTLLEKGDSIITDDKNLYLQASAKATVVCFMIDKDAVFTRNGMYSGMKRN